jgi:SAM-dependent methyltransferase
MSLEVVELSPGDRVLDIACGTGIVARVASERRGNGGHVVGVDLSPDMLVVAHTLAPDIDWRQGDASALPLQKGEQFDIVVCQQGGRLAVATWRSDDEIPLFRDLRRVAEQHLGAIVDQRYSFGDAGSLHKVIQNAGFLDVSVRTLKRTIRFNDGVPFLRLNTMAYIGMSAGGKQMAEDERWSVAETIVNESAPIVQRYTEGSVLTFELSTNLATAKG